MNKSNGITHRLDLDAFASTTASAAQFVGHNAVQEEEQANDKQQTAEYKRCRVIRWIDL